MRRSIYNSYYAKKWFSLYLLFFFSFLVLVFTGFMMYRFTANIVKESKEISRLTSIYENLEELRIGLRTSIIYQKDYSLTDESKYLVQYQQSKHKNFELLHKFNYADFTDIMTSETVDTIYHLMEINYHHLDSMIMIDSLGIKNSDDDIELYSETVFSSLSNINKSLETRIEQKFKHFRSNTEMNAYRSEYFIIFVYSIAIIILLVCFLVLLNQIKKRKFLVNQLEDSNRLKDKFFSIIAHDLRSPFQFLMNLSAFHNGLEGHKNRDRLIKDFMQSIEATTTKTYNLLNNLLNWANSQTGVLKLKKEKFDLYLVIKEVAEFYNDSVVNKNILLKLPFEHIEIDADKNMIATVIRNLLGNAIKFTSDGGLIEIKTNLTQNYVEVSVIDNGRGITSGDYYKLFKIDEDFRNIGNQEGKVSGLGLILCKEFVDLHKGKIYAGPNNTKGSIFSFSLPVN
ncbi:sensor histidine kinase [Plebeiibacterium sediminum]|uniref:histidine kinase n=1 Tax=Plebeiibacterium sediminum TaxID=2992112 RepID=A0AAE3SG77_9BACT|nr:HAMP domain-containing sensor histidine kinase [Plebeiobacterium sediminum]MCW3788188.1 HAMP domain-containing histidine kinase [Plebeiobacterium sediminum]